MRGTSYLLACRHTVSVWGWTPDLPLDELKAQWAKPPSQFIDVQGMSVHLRDEGPRGRTAVQRLQHRRLDLEEAAAGEALAQGRHHADAQPCDLPRLRAYDEVDVALPHPGLLGERLVLDRQGAQGLGRHLPGIDEHAQLAAARGAATRGNRASTGRTTGVELKGICIELVIIISIEHRCCVEEENQVFI